MQPETITIEYDPTVADEAKEALALITETLQAGGKELYRAPAEFPGAKTRVVLTKPGSPKSPLIDVWTVKR